MPDFVQGIVLSIHAERRTNSVGGPFHGGGISENKFHCPIRATGWHRSKRA